FQAAAGQGDLPGVVAQQWRTLHEKEIRANRLEGLGSDRLHRAGVDGGLGGTVGRGAGHGGLGAGAVVAWGSLGGGVAGAGRGVAVVAGVSAVGSSEAEVVAEFGALGVSSASTAACRKFSAASGVYPCRPVSGSRSPRRARSARARREDRTASDTP